MDSRQRQDLDRYITRGDDEQLVVTCSCGSAEIHDHKKKFAKYMGRHYWEINDGNEDLWERRAKKIGFKTLTDAKRAARPFRPERVSR